MTPAIRERLGRLVYGVLLARTAGDGKLKVTSSTVNWDKLDEQEKETARCVGETLFGEGIAGAIAVCETRADNERIFTPGQVGENYAAPYLRTIEDIKAYAEDGKLRPIGGAYAGLTAKKKGTP